MMDLLDRIMIGYVVLLFAAVYICLLPVIKARKKYGKKEFLFLGVFTFTGGLNLPPSVKCKVHCLRSRVVIEANGQEFSLPVEKIVDVSVMSTTEIQKQYVSNVGGAIAGGMLLGPLGAILGGGVRQMAIRKRSKFLIFTYMDTDIDETKYIAFDVTKKMSQAQKFKNKFRSLKRYENVQIDL